MNKIKCDYCNGKKDLTDKVYDDGSKFSDTNCQVNILDTKVLWYKN